MKELREILDFGKLKILQEGKTKDGNTMTIMARFADTKKNANGRTYPARILQREVKKVQERIEAGGFWGMAEHPASGNQMVTGASHIIKKVWFDEKASEAWASLKIIPTEKGRDVMTLIKNGAQLGLSTRGRGDVSSDGTIMDSYKMLGIDIVGSPSSQGAKFDQSNIYESVGFEGKKEEEKMIIKETSEQAIQLLIEKTYELTQKETGITESFEEWKKSGGEAIVRASVAHSDGKYASVEEALAKMGNPEIADELDASECHIDPKDVQAEAFYAGVNPKTYADMLNKDLKERQEARRTGWTREKRQSILREAQRAGCDITTHEAQMKVLNEHKVLPENDKETLFENEVVARHKMLTEEGEDVTLESVREVMKIDREKKEAEEIRLGRIRTFVGERLLAGPNQKF